jgi:hypothetical protein
MSAFQGPAAPKILKTNQFYFLFIQGCVACNIQVVKIRQSMLRTAEPKDETPRCVPFIIGKSQDIENGCI